jgi:hypothetical protein
MEALTSPRWCAPGSRPAEAARRESKPTGKPIPSPSGLRPVRRRRRCRHITARRPRLLRAAYGRRWMEMTTSCRRPDGSGRRCWISRRWPALSSEPPIARAALSYDHSKLRDPSDLTDEEWAILAPLILRAKRGGNKRTIDERGDVHPEHGLPVGGTAEGPAATQHGGGLPAALGRGPEARSYPPCALRAVPGAGSTDCRCGKRHARSGRPAPAPAGADAAGRSDIGGLRTGETQTLTAPFGRIRQQCPTV